EEAIEVVDAICSGDQNHLCDELGDLLLNLAFQVVLAEERGAFSRHEVIANLEEKMRRRHPHLHGLGDAEDWESLKARETPVGRTIGAIGIEDHLHGVPDLLQRAHRIQTEVARVGFDWPSADGALEKVREEVDEVADELKAGDHDRVEEEIGDLLFSVVNLARLAGSHAPTALARANAKFVNRFSQLEDLARDRGISLPVARLDTLDQLWREIKDWED
ncbi:MAG TPA: MazG family protein, partial [Longimicrobiaceae bacterium]|nr:MazG family protein [Longimicrobiaceae bacterium]